MYVTHFMYTLILTNGKHTFDEICIIVTTCILLYTYTALRSQNLTLLCKKGAL